MYRPHLCLSTVLIAATATLAQAGPQADQLPACIKECDPAAIASVNCSNEDQHCACVRQDGILANVTACAHQSCENAEDDIQAFTKLFDEVCHQFNITVPAKAEHGTSDEPLEVTERWSNNYDGNGGGYGNGGNGGGGSGGGGGGYGGWQGGAASSVLSDSVLRWMIGSVGLVVTLNVVY